MTIYRMYSLNEHGHIGYAEEIAAASDGEAIARVRQNWPNALKCEIWEGRRLVAILEAREMVAEQV